MIHPGQSLGSPIASTARFLITIAALVITASGSRSAADIINVPGDAPTIQAAIDLAVAGDEIVLAPTTFTETVDFLGKAVTLRSQDPTDPLVVVQTIIDGQFLTDTIRCVSGEGPDTVINGLIVENGQMTIDSSSPTIINCTFDGDQAMRDFAFSIEQGSNPKIIDCLIMNYGNLDNSGGGGGFDIRFGCSPLLLNCTIQGMSGFSPSSVIYCWDSTPTLNGCRIVDNEGISLITSAGGSVLTIRSTIIENNDGAIGQIIENFSNSTTILYDSAICDNSVPVAIDADTIDGGGNQINVNCPTPMPIGACCVEGECVSLTVADCQIAGGNYQGDLSECAVVSCPPPCPGDLNGDGVVNVNDLLDLLAVWGACL